MTFFKTIIFTILVLSGGNIYSHVPPVASPVTADVVILNRVGDIESINLIFDFLGKSYEKSDAVDMLYIMMEKSVSDINHYFKEISVPYVRESACGLSVELSEKIKNYEDVNLRKSIKTLHNNCRNKITKTPNKTVKR